MKRWIKWTATAVGAVAVVVAVAGLAGWQLSERRMARKIEVAVQPLAYATDAQALARGRYLYESRGCADCHGANGAGRVFVDNGSLRIAGPNITAAGVTIQYKPEDWVRTVRHGVKPGGQPVMIMPSEDYNRLTDADLSALVAHVRGLPPVQGRAPEMKLPPPVRVLYGFGAIKDAAEKIDHSLPPSQPVPEAADAKHGAYVANMCLGCHGEKLSGGKIPGGPPDWPAAANLTPGEGSAMPRYKDSAAFISMLRSGKRPDGSEIKVMPFESISKMSDVDSLALYEYLKTVQPRAFGGR